MRCRARIEREGFPDRYPIWFRNPFRIPTASSLLPFLRHPATHPGSRLRRGPPSLFLPPPSPSPSSYWHPIARTRDESDERGDDSAGHQSSVSSHYVRGPEDSPKKFLGSIRSRARASNTNTVPVRRTSALLSSEERRASVTWNLRNSNILLREKGRERKERKGGGRTSGRSRKGERVIYSVLSGWICFKHLKQIVANGYNTGDKGESAMRKFKRFRTRPEF